MEKGRILADPTLSRLPNGSSKQLRLVDSPAGPATAQKAD